MNRPRDSTVYDIAIIGGGVAGSAAALTLAGSGCSAVMLAQPAEPGDRFGEFLSPAANDLLRALGLSAAFASSVQRPANVTYTAWGSDLLVERNAIVHVDGPGHVLDRASFDDLLRTAAAGRGGATLVAGAVEEATHDGTMWRLRRPDGEPIAARFVIDCSGRAAIVGCSLSSRLGQDRMVAAGSFLRQQDPGVEPTPATLIETVPEGWWYASLLPDGRMVLALFSDADLLPRDLARDPAVWRERVGATRHIRRWLKTAGFDGEATPRLASAATRWLEPAGGTHWLAAGDAAAAFDPLSSHGLTTALWTGRRAALAAVAALGGDRTPLSTYTTTMHGAVQDFLVQRRSMYAQEQRWAAHPFWQRRQS